MTTLADPRPLFSTAVATAATVIGATTPDQHRLPTPCDGFDVGGLLSHMLFALQRTAAIGRGETEFAMEETPVTTADWNADWRAAAEDVHAAWTDDAKLAATVVLPWTTMTGAQALATYAGEITTHTWDLAKATGQHVDWDDELCAVALGEIKRELPVADRAPIWEAFRAENPYAGDFPPPFADAASVPDDARPINQLVAWSGRQP